MKQNNQIKVIHYMSHYRDNSIVDLHVDGDVEVIEEGAFAECPNLKHIHIGPNVKKVYSGAFRDCPQLLSIEYSSVTEFDYGCFVGSHSIKTVRCDGILFKTVFLPVEKVFFLGTKSWSKDNDAIYIGGFLHENSFLSINCTNKKIVYLGVVQTNTGEFSWYNEDPRVALVGTRFIASGKSFSDYFNTYLDEQSAITWGQFQLLTGSCHSGYFLWNFLVHRYGYKTDEPVLIKDIFEAMDTDFPLITDRLRQSLQHQKEPFHMLAYDGLLSGIEFRNDLLKFLNKYHIRHDVPEMVEFQNEAR